MPGQSGGLQSIERAISVLRVFTIDTPELGVTEISQRAGLPKSTTARLLNALRAGGLISQSPETGRYYLGVGLIELAGRVTVHMDVRHVARRHMRILAEETGATVSLAVLEGDTSINLEQAMPRGHMVVNYEWVGRRLPLHATSTGKVLLAWQGSEVVAGLRQPLEAYTSHTITDAQTLEAELAAARGSGYTIEREEYEVGLNAIAAPVRDHSGQVVAALCASGPSYRLSSENFEKVTEEVIATAQAISAELGYTASNVMRERDQLS